MFRYVGEIAWVKGAEETLTVDLKQVPSSSLSSVGNGGDTGFPTGFYEIPLLQMLPELWVL